MTQHELRKIKRQQRQSLTDKAMYSQQIVAQLLADSAYRNAHDLAVYLALPEEVQTQPLITAAWEAGKKVYLPVVIRKGQAMRFAPYTPDTTLVQDAMHLDVPDVEVSQYIDATQLDMVVAPLVAFDAKGNRIGMGGGFYDRTFAFKKQNTEKPLLIGMAYDVQQVEHIEVQAWDVPLDRVVTEKNVYIVSQNDKFN